MEQRHVVLCWFCSFKGLDCNSCATSPVKKIAFLWQFGLHVYASTQLRGLCFQTRLDGSEGGSVWSSTGVSSFLHTRQQDKWRHQCFAQGLFSLLLEHKWKFPPLFFFNGNTWKCSSYYNKVLKTIYYQGATLNTAWAKRASCVKEQKKKVLKLKINVSSGDKRNTFEKHISTLSFQNRLFLWTPFLHPTLPPRSSWSGNLPTNPTGTSLTTWSFASASLKPVSFTSLTTVRKVSHAVVPALSADLRTELLKLII